MSVMLHKPEALSPETPVVICCHGFTGEKVGANQLMLNIAKGIETDRVVVRFDFAGSGESEGEFASDTTVKGWREDLASVVDWVKSQPELASSPVFLLGHSLGGLIVLLYSQQGIAGRVALAPVTRPIANFRDILGEDLWKQAERKLTIANFYNKAFSLEAGFVDDLLTGEYNPLESAAGYPEPLLIIHGNNDVAVPISGSEELFRRYAGAKDMAVMTADHVFSGQHAELAARVDAWLSRQIKIRP